MYPKFAFWLANRPCRFHDKVLICQRHLTVFNSCWNGFKTDPRELGREKKIKKPLPDEWVLSSAKSSPSPQAWGWLWIESMEKYLLDRDMMKLSSSCSPFHSLCPSLSYTYLPLLSSSLQKKSYPGWCWVPLLLMEARDESHAQHLMGLNFRMVLQPQDHLVQLWVTWIV